MATEDEATQFLTDTPIASTDEDEFRHKEYVDTLERMIENTDPPWNIGVFGEWGSGKTSIIKMLYSRLNSAETDYVCVEFDTWKHAEDSIRTDLLLNLDRAIGEETGQTVDGRPGVLGEDTITQKLYDVEEQQEATKDERPTRDTLRQFLHSEKYVAYSIVAIAAISLVAGALVSPSIGAAVFTVVLAPLLLHMAKQLSNATNTLQRKFLYPRKEWSGAYEQLFTEILDQTDADKVLISVDNLDRCESDTVYDVLVSLKTFLEKENCIYIIPCDDRALQSHIESIDDEGTYFEDQVNEREFLRKFFQTYIRIPPFIPEDIEEYAATKNRELADPFDDTVLDVITKAYVKNPRRINQSLNQLTTLRTLAEQMEEAGHLETGRLTNSLDFLAKAMVLEEDYAPFYSELQDDPRLLQDVNAYFRGTLSNFDRASRIETFLGKNGSESSASESQLESFLRSTRRYTVANPRPFLRLGEPSYASDLSNQNVFLQDLRTGQEDAVRDELQAVRDNDRSLTPYVRAVDARLDEYLQERRFQRLFSTVDTLFTVFDAFDENGQTEVATILESYLVFDSVQDFFSEFDPEDFLPVLLQMPGDDQETVFQRFAEVVVSSDNDLRENVLKAFVNYTEEVPNSAATRLCETLLRLDGNLFEQALDTLCLTPASKRLATPELLKKAADRTEWVANRNRFNETTHYTQFDNQAKPQGRTHYVERLLDLQTEVENDSKNQYNNQLQQELEQLDGQVTLATGSRLFNELKECVENSPGQEVGLMKVAIDFQDSYDSETTAEYQEWVGAQLRRCNHQNLQQIIRHAVNKDSDILRDENVVDAVLSQIPNPLGNADFIINPLIAAIPSEHDEQLVELLHRLTENNDHTPNLIAARAFAAYPDRLAAAQDAVLERCRHQVEQVDNVNRKKTYLQAEVAVYDQLAAPEKESFINRIDSLLSGDPQDHQAFQEIWSEVEDQLESKRRTTVARNLRDQFKAELRGNPQANQLFPLVEVFTGLVESDDVDEEDGKWAIERLSQQFESNLNHRQVANLLERLAEFSKYYGKEKQVLDRIESLLSNNGNEQVHESAKLLLASLEQTGDVEVERVNDVQIQSNT